MKGKVTGVCLFLVCVVLVSSSWGFTESTGSDGNNLFGYHAGLNKAGSDLIFIGDQAGYSNSGSFNTFVGNQAGYMNTGDNNSFFGYFAGNTVRSTGGSGSTGDNNSFMGAYAAGKGNSGSYNSFFGNHAGFNNTTGIANNIFGYQAGYSNSTGSGNVFIGNGAGYSETLSNKLYIDNCYTGGTCTSPLIYGDFSANYVTVNGTVTVASLVSVSDERYKKNIQPLQLSLDKVIHLTGVSYEWKTEEYSGRGFKEGLQIGLIAQEVEKVYPELVQTDAKGYKAVAYDKLVPALIEAVKEQQKEIKEKNARVEKLEKVLEAMERRIVALEGPAKTVALK